MKNSEKQAIADLLKEYCELKGSQNKAAASLQAVSPATISQILNGNWELITAEMWRNIAAQIGYDPRKWVVVETEGYLLCEGQQLRKTEYPELFAAIGTAFNSGCDCNGHKLTTTAGFFRLPDLRSRFVVGQNPLDNDYKSVGAVGGEKTHRLTVEEMPPHDHTLFLVPWGRRFTGGGSANELNSGTSATGTTGGGKAHENRPPYYALAYVMRVK